MTQEVNEALKLSANIAFVIGGCLIIIFVFLWRYFDRKEKLDSMKAVNVLIVITCIIIASFSVGLGIKVCI